MSDVNILSYKTLAGVPEGFDALVLSDLAKQSFAADKTAIIHIAHDAKRMDSIAKAVQFYAPDIEIVLFPAWDCLPYDRIGPQPSIIAQRMSSMATFLRLPEKPRLVLTSVNAVTQKVPPKALVETVSFSARPGALVDTDKLIQFLVRNGYNRCSLVTEPGDFAIRGSIVDLFPPGEDKPIRLDFFGEALETIRYFEPETQRTIGQVAQLELVGANEIQLDEISRAKFRRNYIASFGAVADTDNLYESIKQGHRYGGMEHWLPFFYDKLETLFDYVENASVTYDHLVNNAILERQNQIRDYYEARQQANRIAQQNNTPISKHLEPEALYLMQEDWHSIIQTHQPTQITPFLEAEQEAEHVYAFSARMGRNFSAERALEKVNIFDLLAAHIKEKQTQGKRVVLASWSAGARQRLQSLLEEHGLQNTALHDDWTQCQSLPVDNLSLIILELEAGFETDEICFIAEQDIFGDRLIRRKKNKKAANFLTEASSLSPGDLVVHVDHGVGRFLGLETITAAGALHDCLKIIYRNDDKLYLPVENIELLSRYGPDDIGTQLDRLGGLGWQSRKAKLKNKLKDIADELIKIAAARKLRQGQIMDAPQPLYDEFAARFAYDETEDQLDSIDAIMSDLNSGTPMDRLICGDVGFGKTEVALRAAFIAAFSSTQVAIIAPTTLLVRQHLKTFQERFAGLPVNIRALSRLVSKKEADETKIGLANGTVDIVIGTHALLSKSIDFQNLGLVIVDEEQRFGVTHKEQLKKLRNEVHMLTLTATPIPRTMQLALTGVRDLSLISTPPVDRLAVRTFVTPFDTVIIREALLREKYRAGQSFFICPRIADIDEAAEFLRTHVPEVKFIITHGQLGSQQLEERMTAFYNGDYDVLLSTSIIESGIDIPSANTMIIYRADMFGLAQLYQMRGRVGRSKNRAYAYVTFDEMRPLTDTAEKRLKILQSLDSLGAGFTLASHDLDLRGAGNLLGEEQSGHIKEVGFELYQNMLEEAVANRQGEQKDETWSPQINIGAPVLLPESYIQDFDIRIGLYRRLSSLEDRAEIEAFAAELIDRFGNLPEDAENLMKIIEIKTLCRAAGVEKLDAGSKGIAIHFRKKEFSNPEGLINFINDYPDRIKIRPDQSLLYKAEMPSESERLDKSRKLIEKMAHLAQTP